VVVRINNNNSNNSNNNDNNDHSNNSYNSNNNDNNDNSNNSNNSNNDNNHAYALDNIPFVICDGAESFLGPVHALAVAHNFTHATRVNIYAGGDSCSRAAFIAACFAAQVIII
jgi:hypothetical protein